MTRESWIYPAELAEALPRFGLKPTSATPPLLVRGALNDLYRYEIRRLRQRRLDGIVKPEDYVNEVIVLRKRYWPLALQPSHWEQIIRCVPVPTEDPS